MDRKNVWMRKRRNRLRFRFETGHPATVKTEAAELAYSYWTDFWAMSHAKPFWAGVTVSLVLGPGPAYWSRTA